MDGYISLINRNGTHFKTYRLRPVLRFRYWAGGYILNGDFGLFFVYFYLDCVVSVTREGIE